MARGSGATGELGASDLGFVITVMKARYVAPRANANLLHWHYTAPIRTHIDWLARRFRTIGGSYEPARRAAEVLRQIADGDPKVFEPLDHVGRALLERFIEEAGEILATPATVQ